jgi:RNA polymerase sigma-70 factor (ECF subfamily)
VPRDKQAILRELLVLRCQRGDRQAFEELIGAWESRLLYYLRRLVATESEAWDVLQDTWLRMFKGIRSLKSPERLPTWLYQIARCAAMDHWRGRYRAEIQLAEADQVAEIEQIAGPEGAESFENAEQVHHALGQLSPAHREVLTLFFLQDLSQDEMAEVLGIPLGTVKSRLWCAKRALRAVLEREERCDD